MEKYTYAVGRRKTSTATVRLFEGKGQVMMNGKAFEEVVNNKFDKAFVLEPLKLIEGLDKFYFTSQAKGGGYKSQLGAIRHALSRALVKLNPESYKITLKQAGMLRRDDRMVERKKTGLRKARKAPQYSKR